MQTGSAPVPSGAPELGAHNEEVWCGLLGLSEHDVAEASAAGVI